MLLILNAPKKLKENATVKHLMSYRQTGTNHLQKRIHTKLQSSCQLYLIMFHFICWSVSHSHLQQTITYSHPTLLYSCFLNLYEWLITYNKNLNTLVILKDTSNYLRCKQHCLLRPTPPNFTISWHDTQVPQSGNWHASQTPHLRRRGAYTHHFKWCDQQRDTSGYRQFSNQQLQIVTSW